MIFNYFNSLPINIRTIHRHLNKIMNKGPNLYKLLLRMQIILSASMANEMRPNERSNNLPFVAIKKYHINIHLLSFRYSIKCFIKTLEENQLQGVKLNISTLK